MLQFLILILSLFNYSSVSSYSASNNIDSCRCHFSEVQLWGKSFRRQVLWMAKQILQLGMGDAIDDWLLGRIQWLRREEVVASGIQWVKGVRHVLFSSPPVHHHI